MAVSTGKNPLSNGDQWLAQFEKLASIATSLDSALCPDLLELSDIGEADNLRGRVVRAFFWTMKIRPQILPRSCYWPLWVDSASSWA